MFPMFLCGYFYPTVFLNHIDTFELVFKNDLFPVEAETV